MAGKFLSISPGFLRLETKEKDWAEELLPESTPDI